MSTDPNTNKAETAVAYAALILADEGIEITPEKLQALLKAANVEDVEPIWTTLFAKALQGKDVKDILTTVSTSAPEVGRQQPTADEKGDEKEAEGGEGDEDDGSGESDMEGGMFDLFG